jgi:hypothetical protein
VFHVSEDFARESLFLTMEAGGNTLLRYGTETLPPSAIALSPPIVLTGMLPEPTTGILLAIALALVCARRSAD